MAYLNIDQSPRAAFHFEAAREMGRNKAIVNRNLGRALMSQTLYREAAEAYALSLEKEPQNWLAENLLGDCYQKLGESDKALLHWRRALERLPLGSLEFRRLEHKIRVQKGSIPTPSRLGPALNPLKPEARSR